MKKILLLSALTGLGILFTTNCTNNNKSENSNSEILEVELKNTPINNFEFSFNAPSPEEVITLFEDSGLKFMADLLNNPDNHDNYLTSKSLSYNLGVYVTDAAYLNMFNQYALMTGYLESIFRITDKLELTGIYREFDFKKVFQEMDNPDSLIVLSEGVYNAVTNYMIDNNNEGMLCLISYGSFIELLYLTLNSIENFKEDDPILQHITDQHIEITNLYEFAQQIDDYPDIKDMLIQLKKIDDIWNSIEYTESETHISDNEDGTTSIGGGMKHKLTKDQFNLMKNTITEIRTKITN